MVAEYMRNESEGRHQGSGRKGGNNFTIDEECSKGCQ